jgi:hypothetical protein
MPVVSFILIVHIMPVVCFILIIHIMPVVYFILIVHIMPVVYFILIVHIVGLLYTFSAAQRQELLPFSCSVEWYCTYRSLYVRLFWLCFICCSFLLNSEFSTACI